MPVYFLHLPYLKNNDNIYDEGGENRPEFWHGTEQDRTNDKTRQGETRQEWTGQGERQDQRKKEKGREVNVNEKRMRRE